MSEHFLILGGTREAVALAEKLHGDGHQVTTSLAGRTKQPAPVKGNVRTGGFGGAQAMALWIKANGITKVCDATHPFAEQISRNAVTACEIAAVPLTIHRRKQWQQQSGDIWLQVNSLAAAKNAIPAGARVLLAMGSQHVSAFACRTDVHFIIRMVDQPESPLPFQSYELVVAKPSTDPAKEAELLKQHSITHIVCRNSGGEGAYAKIIAARHLAVPVIIVSMPE